MSFKFDGKKVKADMSSALGYAQKSGTKFMNTAGAAVSTAKQMGAKNTAKAAAGGVINAFGKGMKLAKGNPTLGAAAGIGIILGGAANRALFKNKKANK